MITSQTQSPDFSEFVSDMMDARRAAPAWSLVGLSLVCLCTMIAAGLLSSHDCRIEPIRLSLGRNSDVALAAPANTPCTILVRAGSAVVDDISVDAPPERGTLTPRGRTGVVYRPHPGFKGREAFGFSLHGRLNSARASSVIQVRAIVD